ncbi:MAG: hypothetical protein LUE92_04630 [Clostridiales bacterium]|nr:hypothetical protein [Clostridiales bacterium]
MTDREAIENLKILNGFKVSLSKKQRDQYIARRYREEAEVLDMAIAALEKQEPVEPTEIDEDYGYFRCAHCGSMITAIDLLENHEYCLKCGQHLKWEQGEQL